MQLKQCVRQGGYGLGPATDVEDVALGLAAHSDQERILEDELYRFLRFYWDVVVEVAGAI